MSAAVRASRRSFLRAVSGAMVAGAALPACGWLLGDDAPEGLEFLPEIDAARSLAGRAQIGDADRAGARALAEALRALATPEERVGWLDAEIRRDVEALRIRRVEGWVLSQTELWIGIALSRA